jgi:xanthine dehydrogenase accessory factor
VATMGVDDEAALTTALTAHRHYVALVASPTRAATVRQTLVATGVSTEELARLKAPAGLDLCASSQEEIALSILAEIVATRATMAPRANDDSTPASAAQVEAVDPVCGMPVLVNDARHFSEFAGQTWYFCCGGCKARFDADPPAYAA